MLTLLGLVALGLLYLWGLWVFAFKFGVEAGLEEAARWRDDNKAVYYLNLIIEIIGSSFMMIVLITRR